MELYISTTVVTSRQDISHQLIQNGVKNQVTENSSTHLGTVEDGYCIRLFDITEKTFVKKVWTVLKPYLELTCGFVISEYYKGCVLNWPNVLRSTKCPSFIQENIKVYPPG